MERREQGAHELLFDTVFSDIADGDTADYPPRIREAASQLLEIGPGRREIASYRALDRIVSRLWRSRMRIAPVFGGMIVTHELLRISRAFDGPAEGFVTTSTRDHVRLSAIEELLYGLPSEELKAARRIMHEKGLRSIPRDTIADFLDFPATAAAGRTETGDSPADAGLLLADFRLRRRRAQTRRSEGRPGPTEPLEEMLAAHILGETADSRPAHV